MTWLWRRGSPIERLSARLSQDEASGCLEYQGPLDHGGYARIHIGNHRNALAHRVAYEAARGPIPSGLHIDHLCRNRRCCNPAHLEAVTLAENNRRAHAQRPPLTHCKYGHEFTVANTRWDKRGFRECITCHRIRGRGGVPSPPVAMRRGSDANAEPSGKED